MKFSRYTLLIGILTLISCQQDKKMFTELDVQSSGIAFENTLTESDDFNILDYLYFYNGGGTAVGDINNDGLPDIFLAGNQVENRLYLNKGNLQFEDITKESGIRKVSDWNTGAVMGDVNQDGLLDIYVCAVVGIKGLTGYNELYINNGDNTFSERASEFGLDFDTYSSSAAFLDYDLDGDLDIYLLNHAVHTQESFGKAALRYKRNYETGDKLLRNDSLRFTDVSEEAGIYGGVNSYGLGVAISDFNLDGYPDIFVGNDFHEDDYYYINNGDGTFTESLRDSFGYTSRFSMGNDVADINNDGIPDLISLDMLPEKEKVLKMSEGDENINILRLRNEEFGYYYQFSRNMLNIGQSNGQFIETALISGVEATDWSWSALFADFDLDGYQDLYISNGIPKRPNDLDFIKFVSGDQIRNTINNTKIVDQKALDMMPDGAARNQIFKGANGYTFEEMTDSWLSIDPSYSTSSALADLDNDGDLDIITNNVNAPTAIMVNGTNSGNYLKVKCSFTKLNLIGIGTKVILYADNSTQMREMYTSRGFQASSEPILHFGLGNQEEVDSIQVIWPNGDVQMLYSIQANQAIEVVYMKPDKKRNLKETKAPIFRRSDLISFDHIEDRYLHFDRQKLIPFQASDRGPAVAIGDLSGNGKDDLYFGGSKFIAPQILYQNDTGFVLSDQDWEKGLITKEDVNATLGDFNGDGLNDLIIASGGSDFFGQLAPLTNTYLVNSSKGLKEEVFPATFENTSVVKSFDYDNDGDLDVFVGNHSITGDYGKIPDSYLLNNTDGEFSMLDAETFKALGIINDAIWTDFNADGFVDLIVVGEWMSPVFLASDGVKFTSWDIGLEENGLWQSIYPFDIDKDGDIDYMLGNWGHNSKFTASKEFPLKMYYADFDNNGSTETIIAINKDKAYYPIESFDQLASQMVELRKKYTSYKNFAGETVEKIFGRKIDQSTLFEVNQLSSGYLRNNGGKYDFVEFAKDFQLAPITSFEAMDIDGDNDDELIVGGNYFGVKPFMGRLGSFPGAVIWDEEKYSLGVELGLDLLFKPVRNLSSVEIQGNRYLLVTINNGPAELYSIEK